MSTPHFTKAEYLVLQSLLEEAGTEFSNHTCEDFSLPADNPDVVQVFTDVATWVADEDETPEPAIIQDGEVYGQISILFDYFAERCEQLAEADHD